MRRATTIAAAAAAALAWAGTAHAQSRTGLELGAEVFGYRYAEEAFGERVTDRGTMLGLTLGYTHGIGDWRLGVRLDSAAGEVDYESSDGTADDIPQTVGKFEVRVGRDFPLGQGGVVTPFAGLGLRLLIDEAGGFETDSGALGYDREVWYEYVPLGVAVTSPAGAGRTVVTSVQYNWVTGGESSAFFSRVDPSVPDVTVEFNGGYGIEAQAMLQIPRGRGAIGFGPVLRYWNIETSKSLEREEDGDLVEYVEPANRTWQVGARLTYSF